MNQKTKRKMTLEDVRDYYGVSDVVQTEAGFKLPDNGRGFTIEIPGWFCMFWDGGLIDPAEMLVDRMGWMRREMFKTLDICAPVSMRYAFGQWVEDEEGWEFCFQSPLTSTFDSMDLWVEADWDARQGVVNAGWAQEVEANLGEFIVHQRTMPADIYEAHGTMIWVLHIAKSAEELMKLKADFYIWQRRMIEGSAGALEKFESEKDEYREQMKECLKGLPGKIHWIKANEEAELWPKYDANRELWEKDEYDWQIIEFEERLEIRSRGGSPGVISAAYPRCDEVGLRTCRELVAQVAEMG